MPGIESSLNLKHRQQTHKVSVFIIPIRACLQFGSSNIAFLPPFPFKVNVGQKSDKKHLT